MEQITTDLPTEKWKRKVFIFKKNGPWRFENNAHRGRSFSLPDVDHPVQIDSLGNHQIVPYIRTTSWLGGGGA